MSRRFQGRRAVVTGASRGIGAAVARQLAAEGADVAIVARTAERHEQLQGSLAETAEMMRSYGGTVATIVADLTSEPDRARIIPEAEAALGGPIDILINNAAAAIYQPLATIPSKRQRIMFEVNVFASMDLMQAVIPGMEKAGEGWIVNLTSESARMVYEPDTATLAVYGGSKAALNQLTRGLGAELAHTGIRINAVAPRAAVMTEGASNLVELKQEHLEPMEAMVAGVLGLCDAAPEVTGRVHISLEVGAGNLAGI